MIIRMFAGAPGSRMGAFFRGVMAVGVVGALSGGARAQPLNDGCSNATPICGGSVVRFDATFATSDSPAPGCGNTFNSNGVWYRYTAPVSGNVTIDLCGSTYDTVLSVWTGVCGALTAIACDDDSSCGLTSLVTFVATAGTSYLIRVEDFGNPPVLSPDGGVLTIVDTAPSAAAFTFQGLLSSGGAPVSSADMTFRLFDSPTGGTPIGPALSRPGVALANGTTSQLLDFGASSMTGGLLWLEVAVSSPPGSPPVTLSPRQRVSRTPYASRADSACSADNAVTATSAGMALTANRASIADSAVTASSVPWTALTGVPAGFADGVDDAGPWNLAGTVVSYTGGRVGIGTDAPAAPLHVVRADSGVTPNSSSGLIVEGAFINILTASGQNGVLFGNPSGGNSTASVIFNGSGGNTNGLEFRTGGNATHVTITDVGRVGILTTAPDQTLSIGSGNASKPGGGSWASFSDARLKHDVRPLKGSLDALMRLRGVSFYYNDPGAINELPGRRVGMVAQEVEKVFPDWVETGASGYKTVTFRGFEALTVEALRDLRAEKDKEIADLKTRVERLEAALEAQTGAAGRRPGAP